MSKIAKRMQERKKLLRKSVDVCEHISQKGSLNSWRIIQTFGCT